MIGFALGLSDLRATLGNAVNNHLRTWAGAAFVVLAILSIQYEEVIAPGVSRIGDAWSSTAAKLTNLSF